MGYNLAVRLLPPVIPQLELVFSSGFVATIGRMQMALSIMFQNYGCPQLIFHDGLRNAGILRIHALAISCGVTLDVSRFLVSDLLDAWAVPGRGASPGERDTACQAALLLDLIADCAPLEQLPLTCAAIARTQLGMRGDPNGISNGWLSDGEHD